MRKFLIDDITPGMILESDIFKEGRIDGLPLLRKGSEVTAKFIYSLKKLGIDHLYAKDLTIKKSTQGSKHGKMDKHQNILNLPMEKSKSVIKPKTKDEILNISKNLHVSLSGMDLEEIGKVVSELDSVMSQVLSEFPENNAGNINVHQLRSEDDSFYERAYKHSMSVSVISMALGQFLSLPKEEILRLGKCAALHDIGMLLSPEEILRKPNSLEDHEFEIVKKHTTLGYNTLRKLNITDKDICEGIACHHERLNGQGYPLGLKGEKIPLWSRIIAVADVYDAMTNPRPHRSPLSPSEVCDYMMANVHTSFEYDIVMALFRRIEFYPVGVYVELSDKSVAVVLDNSKSKLRPIVHLITSNSHVDLKNDPNYADVNIARTIKLREILDREENKKR